MGLQETTIMHQFTYFIGVYIYIGVYYSSQDKLKKIKELQESIKYIKSYQENNSGFLHK